MRKILFDRSSREIQPLRQLVERQDHRTLVLWALSCGVEFVLLYESRVSGDPRPRLALDAARAWARGEIRMPEARGAALAAHRAAGEHEDDPVACAAARVTGHVVGTVHVETHALGLVFYGLTALVYKAREDRQEEGLVVEGALERWSLKLAEPGANPEMEEGPWAGFLLKERPNRERLLREKQERMK